MKYIFLVLGFSLFTLVSFSQTKGSNSRTPPPTAPLPPAPMPPPPGTPRIVHTTEASSNKLPPAQNTTISYSNSKEKLIIIARPQADTVFITRAEWNLTPADFEKRYGKLPPMEPAPQVIKDYKATSDNFPVKKEKEKTPPVQKVKN